MLAVISLIAVLVISLVIVRVGTVALTLTGLSEDSAKFQALSAFTGTGFTTSESEHVISHPVRRRIIIILIRLGSVGIVSVIVSLMLSFTGIEKQVEGFHRVLYLIVGVVGLWLVARSKWVNSQLTKVIKFFLKRNWRSIEIRDYYDLLHLSEGYGISELTVEEQDWTAGQTLADLGLSSEGFNVLGIRREDGSYIATPRGTTRIMEGDIVLLYGKRDRMDEFESRLKGPEGDQRHHEAVKRHREQLQDQDRQEEKREREWEERHEQSA